MDHRKYIERRSLFENYQRENGLSEVEFQAIFHHLPRDFDIRGASDSSLTHALDGVRCLSVHHPHVALYQTADGHLHASAYIAPSEWMKEQKAGAVEIRVAITEPTKKWASTVVESLSKLLSPYVVYPLKEGKDIMKSASPNHGQAAKKRKSRNQHAITKIISLPSLTEADPAMFTRDLDETCRLVEKEYQLSHNRQYSEAFSYRLDHGFWRLYLRLDRLPVVKIRFPCPPLRHESDLDHDHQLVHQLLESMSSMFEDRDTLVLLKEMTQDLPDHSDTHHKLSFDSLENAIDEAGLRVSDFLSQRAKIASALRAKKERREQFERMVASRPYNEFMYRASEPRKVICFIAPTNSGKSWRARQQVVSSLETSSYGNSVALFPLRMLALENQLWFQDEDIPTSLITGEERDIDPEARLTCQTVETLDIAQFYRTILVDEAQLTFTPDRGPAYLRALVGSDCDTLVLTCSPDAKEQLRSLFDSLGESIEFIHLDRLCPLYPVTHELSLRDIVPGDLVVVFSTRVLHELALQLRQQGFSVGTLYGGMPPSARRHMMSSYQMGRFDVMVATDAIGMGCNCPVDRVLFAQTHKFDGKALRGLTPHEFKQISGRAGRFGLSEKGHFGVVDIGRFDTHTPDEIIDAVTRDDEPPALRELYALPDKEVFMESSFTLKETLECWITAIKKASTSVRYRFHAETIREIAKKAIFLDRLVDKAHLDHETAVRLLFTAFSYDQLGTVYQDWIWRIVEGKPITYLEDLHRTGLHTQPRESLEGIAQTLALLAQFQRLFPDLCDSEDVIMATHEEVGEMIYQDLQARYGNLRLGEATS